MGLVGFRIGVAILATGASACGNPDTSTVDVRGCYFSEIVAPIHVGSDVIQDESRTLMDRYELERSDNPAVVAVIALNGTRAATFQPDTGEFKAWISAGNKSAYDTRIAIARCGGTLCLAIPTITGQPDAQFRRSDCNGAFGMN